MPINNGIINQKGTPAFYSDIFANRPAFGYAGRVFISTDTGAIYEDTGTSWTLIADAGAGTTGTLQQVTTNGNTTTLGVTIQGIDINDGAGTGTENTAIGKSSLVNNTTGINNTALGSYSLGFNTTGANNVAVGVNALQNNTTANSNTAIGTNALQNNTTGTQNNALGTSALQNNTTGTANTAVSNSALGSNTTGINNTAIGVSALQNNTTASFNTAIGVTSLQLNTTGGSNTALGYQSLNANTTGANNTALGLSALSGNTTASNNTAIGHSSLLNNTTGANNSAVGYVSLAANTTGGGNAALGFQSLTNNTTGTNNTSVGSGALSNNTTGISNTAIGSSSLAANLTGSYNVALGVGTLANNLASYNVGIGHSSLNAVTTGTNNSAIGYASGSAITTGSNNTIIGGYGGTTTLASNIVLADGLGNVRLFSDANGLIGINQAVGSTIGGQLDIHTTQTYALVLNGLTTSNAYTAFSNNNVGKWRIGNTYNAGANSFDIFNFVTSATNLSITSAGQLVTGGAPVGDWSMRVIGNATAGNSYGLKVLGGTNSSDVSFSVTPQSGSVNYFQIKGDGFSTFFKSLTAESIGTGTPAFYAKADSGSNNGTYGFGNDNNYRIRGGSDFAGMVFNTAGTEAMRISSIQNLLIGSSTDDTTNKLQVTGSIKATTSIIAAGFAGTNEFSLNKAGNNAVGDGPYFRYINATNADQFLRQLNASSGEDIWTYNTSTAWTKVGNTNAATGVYTSLSDINKKKDFEQCLIGLNAILGLKPTLYRMKTENETNKHLGFIAQEVKEFIPQAYIENENFIGLNYQAITATLVKAIQELNEKLVRNNIN